MIREHQLGYLKEFLARVCEKTADLEDAKEIVETFRKLWIVAKAAHQNPYTRSPRLIEALGALNEPEPGTYKATGQGIK